MPKSEVHCPQIALYDQKKREITSIKRVDVVMTKTLKSKEAITISGPIKKACTVMYWGFVLPGMDAVLKKLFYPQIVRAGDSVTLSWKRHQIQIS